MEQYGILPKYYEECEDGSYRVYVEVGGEVQDLVTADPETGEYQMHW